MNALVKNYYIKYEEITVKDDLPIKNNNLESLYGGKHLHLKKYSIDTKSFYFNQRYYL